MPKNAGVGTEGRCPYDIRAFARNCYAREISKVALGAETRYPETVFRGARTFTLPHRA